MATLPGVEMVAGAGVELAYEERGEGPAVLVVHGMAGPSPILRQVPPALGSAARMISYDRRGYGASQAPEPYERTTVQEQAEDAAALLAALGAGPAVLCGADFGALVCLDLALRHPRLVSGSVLLGPPLLWLVPQGSEELAAEREVLEAALRDGGRAEAVAAWLGPAADPARLEQAAGCAAAFFADWAGLSTWPATRRELRGIETSLVVLDGEREAPAFGAAADALAALAPNARREPGADPVPALRAMIQGAEPQATPSARRAGPGARPSSAPGSRRRRRR